MQFTFIKNIYNVDLFIYSFLYSEISDRFPENGGNRYGSAPDLYPSVKSIDNRSLLLYSVSWLHDLKNKMKFGSNISNKRDKVLSGYPNTENRVENTTHRGVFFFIANHIVTYIVLNLLTGRHSILNLLTMPHTTIQYNFLIHYLHY